ncbi:MAG: hypothetical protein ACI9OU_002681 [Candidatus Promineifilaceae bacterium]|jgi:hypothetical protein
MPRICCWCIVVTVISAFPAWNLCAQDWRVDSTQEWQQAEKRNEGLAYVDGFATPTNATTRYQSVIRTFDEKRSATSITFTQSPVWHNWIPVDNLGPDNLGDAPVMLSIGPGNYWLFGRYAKPGKSKAFQAEDAHLDGFDVPLKTTPYAKQFDAPGGLKKTHHGYHAWQSKDMIHWVHHGSVTERFSSWVTSAEHVDGKTYIYYDFPNDQDPHVYVDEDLTDGLPGKNMGMALKDPSHGSDSGIIRDLQGRFHIIFEDWSPINARKHSWDSPLAGHAVSDDGLSNFEILSPAVDYRTTPTGKTAEYEHPHWVHEDPKNFASNIASYNVHEPRQNAFGDWAAIAIGGRYYLFGDYHPASNHIRVGWFTSASLDEPFTLCGDIGKGHPDPDIAFAEGQFYLITQMQTDYVSPGPWVPTVEARVGVDTSNDGQIDHWTDWQLVKESYDYIEGFSKQVKRVPAAIDLSALPAGFGFCFDIRTKDATDNTSKPILDSVNITFN